MLVLAMVKHSENCHDTTLNRGNIILLMKWSGYHVPKRYMRSQTQGKLVVRMPKLAITS